MTHNAKYQKERAKEQLIKMLIMEVRLLQWRLFNTNDYK